MKFLKVLKKYKWLLIIIIVVFVGAMVGVKIIKNKTTENKQQTLTSTVKKGTITSSISASGSIQTANYLAITTSANGIVKNVYVTEGQQVTKGQKIMDITLDSEGEKSKSDAYSSYLRAKNSGESAKNSLYSLETALLQKEKAFDTEKENNSYQSSEERLSYKYAENDYLKAKNDYELQKSSITQLEIALQSAYSEYQAYASTIYATADGIIANIIATEGTKIENTVSERSVYTLASIKQEGTPTVSLNVTELDINSIQVGQKVKISLSSISDKTFFGTVAGIDKIGTQASGVANYPVIVKFNEDDTRVLPNMNVTAEIIIEKHENVLYVPAGAVNTTKGEKFVTLITNGENTSVKVEIGLSDGNNIEITEGLNEGDTVILSTFPTTGFTSASENFERRGTGIMMGGPGM